MEFSFKINRKNIIQKECSVSIDAYFYLNYIIITNFEIFLNVKILKFLNYIKIEE